MSDIHDAAQATTTPGFWSTWNERLRVRVLRWVAMPGPTVGFLGPICWLVGAVLLVMGPFLLEEDIALMAAAMTLGVAVAIAPAPVWMVGLARRTQRRRLRAAREEAAAVRIHLENAFIEHQVDEGKYNELAPWLADMAAGRSEGAVAWTQASYLRGVAWIYGVGGFLVGAGAATTWLFLEYASELPGAPVAMTFAIVALSIAAGAAFALGPATWVCSAHARRMEADEEEELRQTRTMLVGARRQPRRAKRTSSAGKRA